MALSAGTVSASEEAHLTDTERIARLEHVVGTLIGWLMLNGLRPGEVAELLAMLNEDTATDSAGARERGA